MAAADDLDKVIEQYDKALGEFVKGNPEPVKKLFSHRDYVTLSNPFFPVRHGWEEVAERLEGASSNFRDGKIVGYETVEKYVTPELAYEVRGERAEAKVGGSEDIAPITLRVTTIFRSEDGEWKVVHRHGDPITAPQPAESILQE
jgi:ketosteroid isomerase-like protein